ncbi:MAG: CopD family protein [Haloarculaceae archaeon]
MEAVSAVEYVLHVAFAALLTGGVVFVTWVALPLASAGDVSPGVLESLIDRLTTLSRASAVVLFLTGGHMAGTRYTVASLTGTPRGHLVLTMLGLWVVLTALVEIAASRMRDGLDSEKVRTPARDGGPVLKAASVVALLALLDAGLLASGVV